MKSEIRSYAAEIRTSSESEFALEGTAVRYGAVADLGKFREVVAPGAFKKTLAAGADVKCLLQHDGGRVLGRTANKTLALRDTSDGLQFRCQLDANNPEHRSVYAMCNRGDISECSFGFSVDENGDDWQEATDERGQRYIKRTLKNVNLFEISCVSFPAYTQGTAVQARAALTELDGRTVARAKLAELDAQMDAVNRKICARIGREIAGGN